MDSITPVPGIEEVGMRSSRLMFCAALLLIASGADGAELRGNARLDLDVVAPTGVCASSSELAVLEGPANRLRVFNQSGALVAEAELGNRPLGLVRMDDGSYLVGDREESRLLRVDPLSGEVGVFASGFSGISGLARDGARILVLEPEPARVIALDGGGSEIESVHLRGDFGALHGLAVDVAGQRWMALDPKRACGYAFGRDGSVNLEFGGFGGADGELSRTGSVQCDREGRIYVTDRYQGTLSVFAPDGSLVLAVKAQELQGSPLSLPTDLHVDADGSVYVASSGSGAVHVLALDLATSVIEGGRANLLSPVGDHVVGTRDVRLTAELEALASGSGDLALQFEVVGDLSGDAVATSPEVPVTSAVAENGIVRGETAWTIPVDLMEGERYRWRARCIRGGVHGTWSGWASFRVDAVPGRLELLGNRPNPFNPRTEIHFILPVQNRVEIVITDVRGREVRRLDLGTLGAGPHSALWNGDDAQGTGVASGIYFYLVRAGSESRSGKMALVR
jgi:sugar lactone lactonase YvrE